MNAQWDLSVLYTGFDDPKMAADMAAFDEAISEVVSFGNSLSNYSAEQLLLRHIELETRISSLAEKLFIFANLRYSANTADSEAASIMGVLMGKLSATAAPSAAINKAIAKIQNIELHQPEVFKMQSGKGVSALINNEKIICGNEKYFEEGNVKIDENVKTKLSELRLQGKVSVLIAKNQECIGIIALSDVIRKEAISIVKKLSDMKTDVVLLTGDNNKTAKYFAEQAGIKNVHSELLPEEKVNNIIKLQNEGKTVCMIGDGINDAPALKTANVGIAMGIMGSDIAVEASDIALMKDDISKLPYLKRLANATVKTIKFSISLSMFINFLAIALSVLGMLNPTSGALVHNAGSVFVVLIATFLYDRKFDK